jgi:hypothetical protein
MHMPAVEALFPTPWTAAARRMLPSPSPQLTATEMWGPVLAWCVLQWLAESMSAAQTVTAQPGAAQPERIALDLFDRLRLREPFGHAFTAFGFKGEEAWRAAARIKVLLLTGAGAVVPPDSSPAVPAVSTLPEGAPGPSQFGTRARKTESATAQPDQEQVALAPVLWLDLDVRWLCGVHEAEGHFYLVRELYEELLWWLLMPVLLRLAGEPAPNRAAVEELSRNVANALHSAEAAEYRINTLLGPLAASEKDELEEVSESLAPESELAETTPPAASAPHAET